MFVVLVTGLMGCAAEAQDPSVGYGPNPQLPTPEQALIPVVKAPNAIGWGDGDAKGRPVGVALDGTGALLVADDVGNTIWRVSAAQ